MKKLMTLAATLSVALIAAITCVGLSACKKSSSPVGIYNFSKVEYCGKNINAKTDYYGEDEKVTYEFIKNSIAEDLQSTKTSIELKSNSVAIMCHFDKERGYEEDIAEWQQKGNKIILTFRNEEVDGTYTVEYEFNGKSLIQVVDDEDDENFAFKVIFTK